MSLNMSVTVNQHETPISKKIIGVVKVLEGALPFTVILRACSRQFYSFALTVQERLELHCIWIVGVTRKKFSASTRAKNSDRVWRNRFVRRLEKGSNIEAVIPELARVVYNIPM